MIGRHGSQCRSTRNWVNRRTVGLAQADQRRRAATAPRPVLVPVFLTVFADFCALERVADEVDLAFPAGRPEDWLREPAFAADGAGRLLLRPFPVAVRVDSLFCRGDLVDLTPLLARAETLAPLDFAGACFEEPAVSGRVFSAAEVPGWDFPAFTAFPAVTTPVAAGFELLP